MESCIKTCYLEVAFEFSVILLDSFEIEGLASFFFPTIQRHVLVLSVDCDDYGICLRFVCY